MKFIIKHEIKGRIRISLVRKFHTVREADVLEQVIREKHPEIPFGKECG